MKKIDYSLYLCTSRNEINGMTIEDAVEKAIIGGVTIIQVREKETNYDEFIDVARKIKRVTDKYDVPLIINDNVDVAINVNADGVHIGQCDISYEDARARLGSEKIIGISVTNFSEAIEAQKKGADYIGVGAIFESHTKPDAIVVKKRDLIEICLKIKIPIVVIGGINKNTIPKLKKYNISGFAMIRPILNNKDIITTCNEFIDLIKNK